MLLELQLTVLELELLLVAAQVSPDLVEERMGLVTTG